MSELIDDLRIYVQGSDIIAKTEANGDIDTYPIDDVAIDLHVNSGIISIYLLSNPREVKKALFSNCNDESGTVLGADADSVKSLLDSLVSGGATVTTVTSGSTLSTNQNEVYLIFDSATDEDFTITVDTLLVGQTMTFRAEDVGLPNLVGSGVTISDPKAINGISVELGLIKVSETVYHVI